MTLEMKEWFMAMMDPDLLAADDELVEVWDRIDHGEENEVVGDMAPDLVEEEAVEGGGDFGEAVVRRQRVGE